jgi:hypothetical protein
MQKMISDLLENFRAARSERLNNPFFRNYVIILAALNWKPLLILLFSDAEIVARLDLAKGFMLPAYQQLFVSSIAAIVFVVVGPWVSFLVARIQMHPIRKFRAEKVNLEKLLNQEKIGLFRTKYELEIQRDKVVSEWDIEKRVNEATAKIKEEEAAKLGIENNTLRADLKKEISALELRKADLESEIKNHSNNSNSATGEFKEVKFQLEDLDLLFSKLVSSRNENFGRTVIGDILVKINGLIAHSNFISSISQEKLIQLEGLHSDLKQMSLNGTLKSSPIQDTRDFKGKYKYLSDLFNKVSDGIISDML